jgi:hypothetical protein
MIMQIMQSGTFGSHLPTLQIVAALYHYPSASESLSVRFRSCDPGAQVSLSTYLVVYHQIYLAVVPCTSDVVIKCLCPPLRCL